MVPVWPESTRVRRSLVDSGGQSAGLRWTLADSGRTTWASGNYCSTTRCSAPADVSVVSQCQPMVSGLVFLDGKAASSLGWYMHELMTGCCCHRLSPPVVEPEAVLSLLKTLEGRRWFGKQWIGQQVCPTPLPHLTTHLFSLIMTLSLCVLRFHVHRASVMDSKCGQLFHFPAFQLTLNAEISSNIWHNSSMLICGFNRCHVSVLRSRSRELKN